MTYLHATSTFRTSLPRGRQENRDRVGTLISFFEPLLVWEARLRQRRQLAEMDDHLLQDAGIARADALQEAQKPFWRA